MEYYIRPNFISPPPPLEISKETYEELKNARLILNSAFSFEENYDLLVGNYVELENSALSLATTTMVRSNHEYAEMFELRAEINRRAVNFLSSARLFIDQILQRVGDCGVDKTKVKEQLSAAYDANFEYRFMEALRNHVQHSGSAVHGISFGGDWQPPGTRGKQVFSLQASTHKRFLSLDPQFKKTVLKECPDEVDFLHAARCYLGALSDVHDFARSTIDPPAKEARKTFSDAIKEYEEFSKTSAFGLAAFSSKDDYNEGNVAIFLDWDNVRLKLSKRNKRLHNLSKSVISSVSI